MPIWLRKFTFNKLKEFYDKEQEAADQQSNMLTNKSTSNISRPDIPSYNAKVSTN
jgi:hypothetical protein